MNSPSDSDPDEQLGGKVHPDGNIPGGGERRSEVEPNGCCKIQQLSLE